MDFEWGYSPFSVFKTLTKGFGNYKENAGIQFLHVDSYGTIKNMGYNLTTATKTGHFIMERS